MREDLKNHILGRLTEIPPSSSRRMARAAAKRLRSLAKANRAARCCYAVERTAERHSRAVGSTSKEASQMCSSFAPSGGPEAGGSQIVFSVMEKRPLPRHSPESLEIQVKNARDRSVLTNLTHTTEERCVEKM
jgi:hypothetical protein